MDSIGSSASGGRFAFAALILANVFLGIGPWMVRLADVGPVAAAFWRMALAAPLLLALAAMTGGTRIRWNRGIVLTVVTGGLFFAADLASWHYGIVMTKLANATLFGNAASFLFPIYGFFLLRRGPSPLQGSALAIALVGAMLLLGRSYQLSSDHLAGDLLSLLAGLFYACYLVAIDRVRQTLAPMPVLALSTIASIAPLLLCALLLGETVMPHAWTPLLLLSLGSQLLGQGLLVYAIGYMRPLVVGMALLTQPAVTAMVGWIVYDERLGLVDLAGALLICTAIILIRLPPRAATKA